MNKKGFTMVELLGTMVILAIISTVGIIAINGVLDSGRSSHYNTLLKNIRVAGESYYADKKLYPKMIGQKNEVTVGELVNAKYLDPVKDSNDKECDYEKSKVTAYKTASSSYKYVTTLVCDNYDNSKEGIASNLNINITLTKDIYDKTDKVNIEDQEGGISSYRYRIYKNSVLLYDSGVVDSKGNASEEVALNYKDQVNNGSNIRVVVNATDIYGNTVKKSKSVVIENSLAPICGKSIKGSSTTWTNGNRTISINCKSNGSVNCKQSRYSQTFASTTKQGYITIEGDNGVNSECAVDVYVDKVAPSCTISQSTTAKVKSLTLTINGSDSNSAIATNGYSWTSATTGFSSTRTRTITKNGSYTGYVKDNAGNTAECSRTISNIYSKPAKPTITNSSNGSWTNKNVTLTGTTTTSADELGYWYYSTNNSTYTRYDASNGNKTYTAPAFTSNMNSTIYLKVCNKAATSGTDTENCSDAATTTVRIDKTKPTIGYSIINDITGAQYGLGTWSKNGLYRYLYPGDTGGSGVKRTEYYTGSEWKEETNTGRYWLSERNQTARFRVVDNAGNYSNELSLRIMIDYTNPTYSSVQRICGGTNGKTFKFYVQLVFYDNTSGLANRSVSWYTTRWFTEEAYIGQNSFIDALGTWGNYLKFSHYVCDNAGNCSQWVDNAGVNGNGC